jgi:hypothetical protein
MVESGSRVTSDDLLRPATQALQRAETELTGKPAPSPRRYRRIGAVLLDDEAARHATALADRVILDALDGSGTPLDLTLRCTIVRLGKLSEPALLKVRGYLEADGTLHTVKVWAGSKAVRTGHREVEIRRQIEGIPEYRSAPVLASGEREGLLFLLEPLVSGDHPRSGAERVRACADLVPDLAAGYRATGVGDRRLSTVVHARFGQRLDEAFQDGALPWPEDIRERGEVRHQLTRLVRGDPRVPVAITHGDLVASNIVRDAAGRHHLLDWEHGRLGPAAFDLIKLVLTSGAPERAVETLGPAASLLGARRWRRASFQQQLALGVAQQLSFAPAARRRAIAAGRGARFDAEHIERIRWLDRWLQA